MSKTSHRSKQVARTSPGPKGTASTPASKRPASASARSAKSAKKGLLGLSSGTYWMIGLVMAAAVVGASFLVGGGSSSGPTGVNIRTLAVGSVAPTFSGTDAQTGKAIDASTLAGKNVLYFFNSGSTCQACMVEAEALQKDNSLLKQANITLVMVTNDSAGALVAAARVDKLTIPMVADPTGALTTRFGAVGGGMNMGANTADHSFILVDKTGVVRFHQDFPTMWITPAALINKFQKLA